MVSLAQLWLPILLSAIGVFFASSVLHMLLKFWHPADYKGFANEDDVAAAIRKGNPGPGIYMLPFCRPGDMNNPEFKRKIEEGPNGMMFVRSPGMPGMGGTLLLWFLACVFVSLVVAHIAGAVLAPGDDGKLVFHTTALASFLAYAFGSIPNGIWWGQPWKTVFKDVIDGLIFGAITGAIFAWLWPQAAGG